jgi:hypothetical protein
MTFSLHRLAKPRCKATEAKQSTIHFRDASSARFSFENHGYALGMGTDVLSARHARIDALADRIASLAATIDVTTHALLAAIRQFDAEKGWALQGAKSCAHWVSWRIGLGPVAAREWVRVANALGDLPKIDAALGRGEISFTKVRAMTRVANSDNEDLLLDQAKTATGSQLERVCRSLATVQKTIERAEDPDMVDDRREVRRRNKRDGTVVIEARLMPDEAEAVMQALHMTKARLGRGEAFESRDPEDLPIEDASAETPEPSLADALVALAERQMAALEDEAADEAKAENANSGEANADHNDLGDQAPTPARAPRRRELLVHLRRSDILDATWTAEIHDGTFLDGATFQRLACDTGIVVAHTDAQGEPLDVGRRRRTVPPSLMRALLLRDRHCRFPGCNHQAFVEAHHIEHWSEGGETSKDNLLLVCHAHHVALHECGFSVERRDDGHVTFRDPNGRAIPEVPTPPSPQAVEPHPDPKVNLIDWDGRPADIHGAVRALVGRRLGLLR